MKKAMLVLLLCTWVGMGWAAVKPPTLVRKTLEQPTKIQGYPCAKGYAWFYADGRLKECAVARDIDFGVARVLAGSWVNLTEDGRPDFVFLLRDTNILGYQCRGGNRLLGPTEGAMTGFYPSGKLKVCWLAEARDVQGVPCAGSGLFSGKSQVSFYESGKLRACQLSRDYGGRKQGERFERTE